MTGLQEPMSDERESKPQLHAPKYGFRAWLRRPFRCKLGLHVRGDCGYGGGKYMDYWCARKACDKMFKVKAKGNAFAMAASDILGREISAEGLQAWQEEHYL